MTRCRGVNRKQASAASKKIVVVAGIFKIMVLQKLARPPPSNFSNPVDLAAKSVLMQFMTIYDKAQKLNIFWSIIHFCGKCY